MLLVSSFLVYIFVPLGTFSPSDLEDLMYTDYPLIEHSTFQISGSLYD